MIIFTNHCGQCKRYIGKNHDVRCMRGSDNKVLRKDCYTETKPKGGEISKYKPPRPLSIAVTNQEQYLLGHKRGWDDAEKRIAKLEAQIAEMVKREAIRDLEQQELGIKNLRESTGFWDGSNCSLRTFTREYEKRLRQKAKE